MEMEACPIYSPVVTKELHGNIHIIAISGLISACLSLIGASSIIGFIIWNRLLRNEQTQPLFHLTVSDFFLSLMWITSTIQYFVSHKSGIEYPGYSAVSCFVWQLITEMAHLVTFFLTVNYSVHVYFKMKDRTVHVYRGTTEGDESPFQLATFKLCKKLLYITSWCLPIILMMPIIANIRVDNVSACQKCVILIDVPTLISSRVSWSYGYAILALSLTFSMTLIIILYCTSLRTYWKAQPGFHTDHQRKQLAHMQIRVTCYVLVFLLCWTPALIISYHKWVNHPWANDVKGYLDVNKYIVLYIFQSVLAPLQGLLNSIVYGWSRKTFRGSSNVNLLLAHERESFRAPYHAYDSTASLSDDGEIETDVNVSSETTLLGY